MHLPLLFALALAAQAPEHEVLVSDPRDPRIERMSGFQIDSCPYSSSGSYLVGPARHNSASPGSIRIAAPAGQYYVYVAWIRHPEGAKDVRIKLPGAEVRVDQSRLANGKSPDDFEHNDWEGKLCTSGLYRLTDKPVAFGKGDAIEVFRSDTTPGTVTTFDYVLFSRSLYLDDLGNDVTWLGRPLLNLKNYGKDVSGHVGWGLAIIPPRQPDTAFEWTIPADGRYLVSVMANRGPNRATSAPLEIDLVGAGSASPIVAQKSERFGRAEWEQVAFIEAARGAKLRVRSAKDGFACPDLIRLTPVAAAELVEQNAKGADVFTVQWEDATPARPWLRDVRINPAKGVDASVEPLSSAGEYRHGAQVKIARRWIPLLGSKKGLGLSRSTVGSFCVELADDYGFTLSTDLLRREPFVWLRDLGIFACTQGDYRTHRAARESLIAQVDAQRKKPFRSTSEKYIAMMGYDEARPGHDDRAFEFAYRTPRAPEPRVSESLKTLPEVDYAYFADRVGDVKSRRMFLGWPNVCQKFYVLSSGAIGASASSVIGTGHPPAEDFALRFGIGDSPVFKDHGDRTVTQNIEDGYHLIVHTRWQQAKNEVWATAFAYPLQGEEVRSGIEPLAAFVRLRRTAGAAPLWLKLTPEHYGAGEPKPLTGLDKARIENGRLWADRRIVLTWGRARAALVSNTKDEVLVRFDPEEALVDLIIPYVAVEGDVVAQTRDRGYEKTLAAVKQYWDRRLARGTKVDLPDSVAVNQFKTLYPRTVMTGNLDTEGNYVLKTSPLVYEYVWLHVTAEGIEGLARRGHFEEAKQYLEPGFRWQSSQADENTAGSRNWVGFFGVSKRYTACLWINFHGWFQWAAARYFLYSDDRQWLDEKLPALIKSLEWTDQQRKLTMKENPDGARPLNYGWIPAGRVSDGSFGTSAMTDCVTWMGANELVAVLERIGHPRAKEFRRMADDYRGCLLRSLHLAARGREPVRLNDGTYVPYVPGYLESQGHEETMWFAAVVDGALESILDAGILNRGDPLEDWVLGNLEDNLFVMAPNLADEGHSLGHALAYLRRDETQKALYTFFSLLANESSRQTLTTYEHRSSGAGRVYDLAPWAFGYYTRVLAGMLAFDEGEQIIYCRAIPRRWLDPGKTVSIERLQTRFGPTSFRLTATADRISGVIEPPVRYQASALKLRLRINGQVQWVRLNGQTAAFDQASETVSLPRGLARIEVEAGVRREK